MSFPSKKWQYMHKLSQNPSITFWLEENINTNVNDRVKNEAIYICKQVNTENVGLRLAIFSGGRGHQTILHNDTNHRKSRIKIINFSQIPPIS